MENRTSITAVPQKRRLSSSHENTFSDNRRIIILCLLILIMLFLCIGVITFGAYGISVSDTFRVLLAHISPIIDLSDISNLHKTVIWNLRVPRIILAVCGGLILATSGAVYQACFRNPLVEPYILGASQGAAFGAALGMIFPHFPLSIQVSAFFFSVLAVSLAYATARVRGENPLVTLILGGVIIASVFSGLVSILKYIASDAELRGIVFWMMGGFYYATWKDVSLIAPVAFICFFFISCFGWKLNILTMGDEEAKSLGVKPEKYKFILIGVATLGTAVMVSSVGIIAWVGLMMPHAARIIIGPDNRYVVPVSGLLGVIYLIICDTMARTLTSSEIPVGILTSLVGAPYLFFLLRTKGKEALG